MSEALDALLQSVRACRICEAQLEPRPVLRLSERSRVIVIGQAPGSKVHASGVPWDDPSGDHLREWLGVTRSQFDDVDAFGILPMAFCYPGKGKSADLPPPPICAQKWHDDLVSTLSDPPLVLLIGIHAQRRYLGATRQKTLTETVRHFEGYLPRYFPLPHPSWRSRHWIAKNPWFVDDVLPELRARVIAAIGSMDRVA